MDLRLRYDGDGRFFTGSKLPDSIEAGRTYTLEYKPRRSKKSHDHFFACIDDAWANLPEQIAHDFPSPTSLRKFALCRTGYCTIRKIICASPLEAKRTAAWLRSPEKYSIAEAFENIVTVYEPESQSIPAMGAKRFQQSKDAVLQYVSELIGADAAQLGRAA